MTAFNSNATAAAGYRAVTRRRDRSHARLRRRFFVARDRARASPWPAKWLVGRAPVLGLQLVGELGELRDRPMRERV